MGMTIVNVTRTAVRSAAPHQSGNSPSTYEPVERHRGCKCPKTDHIKFVATFEDVGRLIDDVVSTQR
jgi:hypothetical protein